MAKEKVVNIRIPGSPIEKWGTESLVRVGAEIATLSAAHLEPIKDELRWRAMGKATVFTDGRFHSASIGKVATVSDRVDWQSIAKELLLGVDDTKRAELMARYTKPGIVPKQKVILR